MKHQRYSFAAMLQGLVLMLGIAWLPGVALAASDTAADKALRIALAVPAVAADKAPRKDLVLKGDAKCTRCHDETEEYPVLDIAKTRHGVTADKRTPTCTSCHGESNTHANKPADAKERPKTERSFGKKSTTTAAVQSGACLTCHEKGRISWQGSKHQTNDVACSSCHTVHLGKDKVQSKATQTEVCFACHKTQRAEMNRASTHPVGSGQLGCSSCHNPHGASGPSQLVKNTVNETCYTCHAEKRGPFLWDHPVASDNCANCHTPHGSNHAPLLKARAPILCQSCHLIGAGGHPNSLRSSGSGITATGAQNTIAFRACLNCHTQVHGSNHPSGPRFVR